RRQELHREPVLHQGLPPAEREPALHDLESLAVLAQLLGRPTHAHGDSVGEGPGVGIVTIAAAPHAARGPRNDPHAGPVHRGPGGVRVEEAHVAGLERFADGLLGKALAETHAQLVGTLGRERSRTGSDIGLGHGHGHAPWNVLLMTSVCWSRVSRTKLTA